MPVIDIYYLISNLCLYSTILLMWLIWKNRSSIKVFHEAFFFLICLGCHLLFTYIDDLPLVLAWIIVGGAILNSMAIWFLSRAIFNEKKLPKKKTYLIIVCSLTCYYGLAVWDKFSGPRYPDVLMQVISLGYLVLAIMQTRIKVADETSIPSYRLKRNIILSIAAISLFTISSELALQKPEKIHMMIIQRIFVLGLIVFFIDHSFSLRKNLLDTKKEIKDRPSNLAEKIKDKVIKDKLYLLEKLTIRQLAEELNEQEYKIRKAINQDLGYKNFLEFVNSF
ncbi:MAG: hypothetical protein AAF600_21930, partial [Bacteroidota bacterium]